MEATCKECNKIAPLIKELCKTCYGRTWWTKRPSAKCHPDRKNYAGGWCKACYRLGERAPKATCHPDKPHAAFGLCATCLSATPERKAQLVRARRLRKYNLTVEDFNQLHIEANGKCEICFKVYEAIDHDHTTGKVRGLLCKACNAALGLFCDNVGIMENAIKYIKKHEQ